MFLIILQCLVILFLFYRLIITLPHDKHDLSATRYYIALLAISSLSSQTTHIVPVPAYGTVFFRQDQLHIDLFVFFSVFFSCFFLFLAVCVVGWKAKQVNIIITVYLQYSYNKCILFCLGS